MNCYKNFSRRAFIKNSALGLMGISTYALFPKEAKASNSNTKVLFLNLNGGLDGLYALQPNSGSLFSTLQSIRPTLAQNPSGLLDIGSSFSFHQNLSAFQSLYSGGDLLPVLGVGVENMSRSHLDAEVAIARGTTDRLAGTNSGFLSRLGAHYNWDNLRAVSVSGNDLSFEGDTFRGVQVRGLESFYFHDASPQVSERSHVTGTAFGATQDFVGVDWNKYQKETVDNFSITVNSVDTIKTAVQSVTPAVSYPNTQFGRALKDINILFAASGVNTQIGYIRAGGFDTHSNQQTVLNTLLSQLNASLDVFVQNMKLSGLWSNLIIVILSEFGRTNVENGSGGTDHGGANTVFLAGGPVNGGQIIGSYSSSDLTSAGWLQPKINLVSVYRQVLMQMNLDPDAIFAVPSGNNLSGIFT